MQATKKNKVVMQQPDFTVSKVNQERATKLFDNFMNGTKRQIEKDMKAFSTFAFIKKTLSKSEEDPSDKHILEVIKRLERDRINSQISLQLSEMCQAQAQNLQKITLIKMIPFFVGILGMIILSSLALTTKPLEITNPDVYKFLIPMVIFLPLLVWGWMRRKDAKLDMVATNIVLQATSAYASAKMQGKGQIGAMQNLEEMRRRAKSMEGKKDDSKDKKKKSKKK